MDYYTTLLVKTLGPLAVVALFWMWPLSKVIQGAPYAGARGTAAKLSLFWLELLLVSVSTTIMQCFMCTEIGGKAYLRAQLTLECDGQGRRQVYVIIASLMILVYPIGELTSFSITHLLESEPITRQKSWTSPQRASQAYHCSFLHLCTQSDVTSKPSCRH